MSTASLIKYIDLSVTSDARLCVRSGYTKNYTETSGELLLSTIKKIAVLETTALYQIGKEAWNQLNNPKVCVVASTILALASISLAFYPPVPSAAFALHNLKFISYASTLDKAKYVLFIHIETAAAGVGLRTYGRFSNDQLMDKFYKSCGDVPKDHVWEEAIDNK